MNMLDAVLLLSAALFCLGAFGVILRRNAIVILLCIELMLNGVNLAFIAFGTFLHSLSGVVFVFFVLVIAAAEAVVGLSIILAIFRNSGKLEIERINLLKG